MKTIWNDELSRSEDSDQYDEEMTDVYLMVMKEKLVDNRVNSSYNELFKSIPRIT